MSKIRSLNRLHKHISPPQTPKPVQPEDTLLNPGSEYTYTKNMGRVWFTPNANGDLVYNPELDADGNVIPGY